MGDISNQKTPNTDAQKPAGSNIAATGVMPKHFGKRAKINLAVILLVVFACVGGYLYYNNHQSKNVAFPHDNQTYTSLNSYSLTGKSAGQGMSFKLPSDFTKLAYKPKTDANFVSFLQHSSKDSTLTIGGAYANAAAYLAGQGPPDTYLQAFNDKLKAADKQFIGGQTTLATSTVSTHFTKQKLAIQSLKAFTNGNIKSGAWVVSFKVSDTKSNPIYQGQLVYVISKAATYNFLVYTSDYNWNTNQSVWTQVFNSLKVDQ